MLHEIKDSLKDYIGKWCLEFGIDPETKGLMTTIMISSFVAPICVGLILKGIDHYLKKREKK